MVSYHNLDAKARLILPSIMREEVGDKFYITTGLDNCLFVFGIPVWEKFKEKIRQLSITDTRARRFERFFFGSAILAETDAQGRTIIPPHLKEHAGLSKEVVSVGLSSRIEIWSKENWTSYNQKENTVDEDLAQYMTEIGF